jgi:hypothetical protein
LTDGARECEPLRPAEPDLGTAGTGHHEDRTVVEAVVE